MFTGPIAGLGSGYKDFTIEALKFWVCVDEPDANQEAEKKDKKFVPGGAKVLEAEKKEEEPALEFAG